MFRSIGMVPCPESPTFKRQGVWELKTRGGVTLVWKGLFLLVFAAVGIEKKEFYTVNLKLGFP